MSYVLNLAPKGLKAVTPSDSTLLANVVGLRCTAAGNVSVTDHLGNTTTVAMTVGENLVLRIRRVNATGTTATVLAYLEA